MQINFPSDAFFVKLKTFAENSKFDDGHGYDHFIAVFNHAKNAIASEDEELERYQENAILYATLLHDVDDAKFFPNNKNYENARAFLQSEGYAEDVIELVIKMISLVSCSKNGNNNENISEWMLFPRFCDRLEAIGKIGIQRAIIYGKHKGRPMHDNNTERVETEEQLQNVATAQRFENYVKGINHSNTTIGHFYDKILHLGKMNTTNSYILKKREERMQEVTDFLFDYWRKN